jgi:hypothetical protein
MATQDACSSSQTCISFRPTTCLLLATSETLARPESARLGIGRACPDSISGLDIGRGGGFHRESRPRWGFLH